MTRLGYVLVTALAAELFGGLFVTVAIVAPRPRLIWNASASAPMGLYALHLSGAPAVGDLVAATPPDRLAGWMAERRYLPRGVPLLKHVAAKAGQRVCRKGDTIRIDGRVVATALDRDSHGRPLPDWQGCRSLGRGDIFLLNAAVPDSLDGRYFGALPVSALLGRATPILTRDAADAPLRWRISRAEPASPPTTKGSSSCKYPQDSLIALRRQNAEASAAAPIAAGIDIAALNFRYAIDGDNAPWRPLRAFDDGRQVFIEFPAGIAQGEMPPLFVVGPAGGGELVNYRVQGRYMVVDRLFGAAELRMGDKKSQQKVRVTRTDGTRRGRS